MRKFRLHAGCALACLLVAGCSGGLGLRWGAPQAPQAQGGASARTSARVDNAVGAMVIGVMLADGPKYYTRYPDGTRVPYFGAPEPDPDRRINLQDCTQPIDLTAGNLKCR